MLEAAITNAADGGNGQAVYTLNQLHSDDWVAWNAAFAALLLATGLGALRNGTLVAGRKRPVLTLRDRAVLRAAVSGST